MAISTNSIIHYTDSYSNLISILTEGFRIKYCLEKLNLRDDFSEAAHPMISFCDIPLSGSMQHFDAYGKYGIGLSKEWASKNGINPVIYIDHNSLFAKSILELINDTRFSDMVLREKEKIYQIKSYAKNYSGPLKRRSVDDAEYKFYDEREWRLVPTHDNFYHAIFCLNPDTYLDEKDKFNDLFSGIRVTFSPEDISYIIVKDNDEIPEVTKFLRATYSEKCTGPKLDVLFSKICSTEQIIADY